MKPVEHTTTAKQDLEVFSEDMSRQAPENMKSNDTIFRLKDIYEKAVHEKDDEVAKKCRDWFDLKLSAGSGFSVIE